MAAQVSSCSLRRLSPKLLAEIKDYYLAIYTGNHLGEESSGAEWDVRHGKFADLPQCMLLRLVELEYSRGPKGLKGMIADEIAGAIEENDAEFFEILAKFLRRLRDGKDIASMRSDALVTRSSKDSALHWQYRTPKRTKAPKTNSPEVRSVLAKFWRSQRALLRSMPGDGLKMKSGKGRKLTPHDFSCCVPLAVERVAARRVPGIAERCYGGQVFTDKCVIRQELTDEIKAQQIRSGLPDAAPITEAGLSKWIKKLGFRQFMDPVEKA